MGTVQGSSLGPILYAIFVSPLLDLAKMTLFDVDNYVIQWNQSLALLIFDIHHMIESITKWFGVEAVGLRVNDGKLRSVCSTEKTTP